MKQPVFVVRHGQSEWNLVGLTQGQTAGPQLTAAGRAQAARAAAVLREALAGVMTGGTTGGLADVRLHTSDLARARETAQVIGDALGVEPRLDARLRERHFGLRQGRDHATTTRLLRFPGAGALLRMESAQAVGARLHGLLAELDASVAHVLVTHGEAMRLLTEGAAPVVPNGAVLELVGRDPGTRRGRWAGRGIGFREPDPARCVPRC